MLARAEANLEPIVGAARGEKGVGVERAAFGQGKLQGAERARQPFALAGPELASAPPAIDDPAVRRR
jgi:hypothetical protein